jgi:hypothetical protein
MKVFRGPLLRRLARDLAALMRLIDMIAQETERQNGRKAAREARRKLKENLKETDEWPEPGPDWPE